MTRRTLLALVIALAAITAALACRREPEAPVIRVASLRDVEGQVLGEMFAQLVESTGEARVERRLGLGGPGVVFAAFEAGEVDLVPQYSGSLAEELLREPRLTDFATIRRKVEALGYEVLGPLGFNNTYGIGVKREVAERFGLRRISDLRGRAWRGAVTPEFREAVTGLGAMVSAYRLALGDVRTMEHALSYVALARGEVDFVDVYTTDATIRAQDLVVLDDDLGAFVRYEGLVLARTGFAREYPRSWAALGQLVGRLSDATMTSLNGEFEIARRSPSLIAADFLTSLGIARPAARSEVAGDETPWVRLTLEHLGLVAVSLAMALAVGLPLGWWASQRPAVARSVLSLVGVIQTIPGIALLCFFIPVFGVGWEPAVYALAAYALLPIVQGVVTGLTQIDASLRDVAAVLGMTDRQRRRRLELPLAAPALIAGVRVAAVINVGTAALAALVGAGGYGTLIVTGLAINDWRVVMLGALPSAGMAMLIHALFAALESRASRWQ
ncbi:MAG TPA: glycine betaine ABC transporter substrate-binding protein [Myxococcota bacterium]|nr:glycine betaine ABC transporter substrate-binding protein [Myxococcota bacterium]